MKEQLHRIAAIALVSAAGLMALGNTAFARNIYVGNLGSDNVSVLDSRTNTVIGTIPVGDGPSAMAIAPDGSRAYVVNQNSDSVSVIDLATNTTLGAPIPVGDGPSAIAITPDGSRAYVAIRNTNSVSMIDTRSNTVVGPAIGVGSLPQGIAITPDGARAYVSNDLPDHTLSVIDTSTNTTVGPPIAVGNRPGYTAITPDGAHAYITRFAGGSVAVLDIKTNTVIGAVPVGSGPAAVAVTPDGSRAYVPSVISGSLSTIDLQTNTVGTIPFGTMPRGIAITPDGRRAYIAMAGGSNTVAVLDTATNTVSGEVGVGTGPLAVAIPPNQPPRASLSTHARGLKLTLDGSASSDPDGAIATYGWNFGDGTSAETTSPTVNHTYTKVSKYRILLTVSDGEGCPGFVFTGHTASCNGPSISGADRLLATARIVKLKRDTENGTATLRVLVPGKVVVDLSGKGILRQRRPRGGASFAALKHGLGRASLRIKAKGKARRKLDRTGIVKVEAKVTVRPIGGDPNVQMKRVKLVKGTRRR